MDSEKKLQAGNHRSKILAENIAFGVFRVLSGVIVTILFIILAFIIIKGASVLNWEFITTPPTDGMKGGFDLEMLSAISSRVRIPIIASGGAGCREDFRTLFRAGCADAGLAASIFHYEELLIPDLKHYLAAEGIPVRL